MSAVIIEHVNIADLPEMWRAKLRTPQTALVTVRIEEEDASQSTVNGGDTAVDLLFGMWRDREDMADVAGYVRSIRASRFSDEGAPRTKD